MLTSNGLEELCGEILNTKCDSSFKPQHIPDILQKPRMFIEPKKSVNSKVYAFIYDLNVCYKEIYNGVSCKALPPVETLIDEETYAIIQWETSLFTFGKKKRIICTNIETSVITSVPDIPVERENYAVVIHDNNIYILGGEKVVTSYRYEAVNMYHKYVEFFLTIKIKSNLY